MPSAKFLGIENPVFWLHRTILNYTELFLITQNYSTAQMFLITQNLMFLITQNLMFLITQNLINSNLYGSILSKLQTFVHSPLSFPKNVSSITNRSSLLHGACQKSGMLEVNQIPATATNTNPGIVSGYD